MPFTHASPQVQPAAHERSWRFQRVCWAAGAIVLALAFTGRLGGSSASRAEASSPEGTLRIAHDRYCRSGLPTRFELRAHPDRAEFPLTIDGDFLEHFQIRAVTPRPLREEAGSGGLTLVFAGSGPQVPLAIECQTRGPGIARSTFRAGGEAITLDQFIYP